MTIKEFMEISNLSSDEILFDVFDLFSQTTKVRNLSETDLISSSFYNEEIKALDIFSSGDISGESCLSITFSI